MEHFDLPQNLAAGLGGGIGSIGVTNITALADRFADFKLPSRSEGQELPPSTQRA
ncbi:hypothetical protein WN939_11915 [Pseudomonas soli]|nr:MULTISPECIES: hypothetical protein [Pseudomonas]